MGFAPQGEHLVRHGFFSITLLVIAISVFFYAIPFGGSFVTFALFYASMAVAGLVLAMATRLYSFDANIQEPIRKILPFILMGAGGIFALNLFVSALPPIFVVGLATSPIINLRLLVILIAVAEESFFRGFFAPWFARRLDNRFLGAILSGGAFAIYHLAVYQSFDIIAIVVGAGIVLSFIALRSGWMLSTSVAHIINNAVAPL